MNNLKKMLALLLVLAMAMSLCACGGETAQEPAGTEAPAVAVPTEPETEPQTEAPAETEAEGGYTVTVQDENGAPIAGAMVQLCKDACVPGMTNAEGVARFNLPEDDYKVSFLALPAGFAYVDEVQEFYFDQGSMDMIITLKAAE